MRRQHLFRAASTKSLCIFCALHLSAEVTVPRLAIPGRRHINTTSRRSDIDGRSVPAQKSGGFGVDKSSLTGQDAGSSLSPAEQAEKARRLQQREEQAKAQRAIQWLAQEQQQKQQQKQKQNSQAQHQKQQPNANHRSGTRRLNLGRIQSGLTNGISSASNDTSNTHSNTANDSPEARRQNAGSPHSGSLPSSSETRNSKQNYRLRGTPVNISQEQARKPAVASAPSNDQAQASGQPDEASVDRNLDNKPITMPKSQRIAAPSFSSTSKAHVTGSAEFKAGWGSGGTVTKPLEHGERKDLSISDKQAINAKPIAKREQSRETSLNSEIHSREQELSPSKSTPVASSSDDVNEHTVSTHPTNTESISAVLGSNVNLHETETDAAFRPKIEIPEKGQGTAQSQGFGFGSNSSSGYETAPLQQDASPESATPSAEDRAAHWQHLRRQNIEHIQADPGLESPSPSQQSHQVIDDAWVDRSFEEHRRKRAVVSPRPNNPDPSTNPPPNDRFSIFGSQNANKRCARCGEMGHIARQCPGRTQLLCHACGQPGHMANRCPNVASNQGSTSNSHAYLTDPFAPVRKLRQATKEDTPSKEPVVSARFANITEDQTGGNLKVDPEQRQTGADRRSQWEHAPESPVSDEQPSGSRASRRDQWANNEDEIEQNAKGSDRRGQRRNRRQESEDDDDEGLYARDQARLRKQARLAKKEAEKKAAKVEREARKAEQATPITIPAFVSVQNLSQMLGVRYEQFVDRLEELGYDDVFPGKVLNTETSSMIAMEYNFEPTFDMEAIEEEERDLKAQPESPDKDFLPVRPPVVTIMGHVDHGKTTILDYLRKSSVAAGEAGGITQHIGAFSVPLASSGKTITFLDTPGHAAFLAMRQRGANVTDIVILVVAADDSVKPQTLEAIKHAKAAGVPMIVAINKVDKEEADVQRCKQDLARHGVEIEDFGGDTQVVEVSGKTGRGMDDLEETVVTLSEILDHRADVSGNVEGWVLEATTKKAGRVATVLVRRGTLRPGSIIVAGKTWARVKTLRNEGDRLLDEVGPGMPIEVDGWKDQPVAGDEVLQASSERKAASVVEYRLELTEREKTAQDMEIINEARRLEQERREREKAAETAARNADEGGSGTPTVQSTDDSKTPGQIEVPFIIKADVSGSAEAVSAYILGVSNPMIIPKILHSGVGAINESDIELASAAQGNIIAFNLRSDAEMNGMAEARGVKVLENNIIYRVLDDVKAILEAMLPPIISQKVLGEAEVAASFEIGIGGRKKMTIAGCKVRNGVITKGSRVRVLRKGEKLYDGTIDSLKNVKKDVQEMRKGTECGIGFDHFEKFETGDQIQTYEEISEKRRL